MKKIFILAWAAVPALVMSACNGTSSGGSGVSALPNTPVASAHRGRVHRNDNGPGDIHAGGATFPAYGYNLGDQPVGAYNGTQTQPTPGPGSLLYNAAQANGDGNNFYYCLTGSGYGRKEFEGRITTGTDACVALGLSPSGFGGRTDPIDFAGSDVAMPGGTYNGVYECCGSGSSYDTNYASSYGQPFEVPTFGGPIVIPYINNGSGTSCQGLCGLGSNTLQLSTWTYCAIANGTIGYWDDAAITADNGGVAVAGHQPITFYYRSDGSGTTFLFTNKLNSSTSGCNETWKGKYARDPYQDAGKGRSAAWSYGVANVVTDLWPGPTGTQTSGSTFTGESGNPGILQCIQNEDCATTSAYPYATGYAEGAWAAQAYTDGGPPVEQAALLNGCCFVSPTSQTAVAAALATATSKTIQYGEGVDGISLDSSTPYCQLLIPPSAFVSPRKGTSPAYPIVGLSYFLFYGKNQVRDSSNHYTDLKGLITYMESTTWANDLPAIEYSPLPTSTRNAVLTALKGIKSKGQGPCLSS